MTGAGSDRSVGIWLLVCTVLIGAMVVIGGLTRLTGSGLSITEWDLVMGTIPPLDQDQWEEVFQKYRQSPEYLHVNSGMSLAEFKAIFWWEYIHRLLGRVMGFAFIIPLGVFIARRQLARRDILRLSLLFVLGGLQGLLGWYMVMSGLVKIPHVSHLRLTAHLTLAFLLFGSTLWLALQFLDRAAERPPPAMVGCLVDSPGDMANPPAQPGVHSVRPPHHGLSRRPADRLDLVAIATGRLRFPAADRCSRGGAGGARPGDPRHLHSPPDRPHRPRLAPPTRRAGALRLQHLPVPFNAVGEMRDDARLTG